MLPNSDKCGARQKSFNCCASGVMCKGELEKPGRGQLEERLRIGRPQEQAPRSGGKTLLRHQAYCQRSGESEAMLQNEES